MAACLPKSVHFQEAVRPHDWAALFLVTSFGQAKEATRALTQLLLRSKKKYLCAKNCKKANLPKTKTRAFSAYPPHTGQAGFLGNFTPCHSMLAASSNSNLPIKGSP